MGHMGDFVTFPGEWFRGGFLHDRLGKRLRGFRGALKGGKNVMIIYQRFFPHAVPLSGEMKKSYQISPPLNKANFIACPAPLLSLPSQRMERKGANHAYLYTLNSAHASFFVSSSTFPNPSTPTLTASTPLPSSTCSSSSSLRASRRRTSDTKSVNATKTPSFSA